MPNLAVCTAEIIELLSMNMSRMLITCLDCVYFTFPTELFLIAPKPLFIVRSILCVWACVLA